LGGATPLLQFPGVPTTITKPVSLAVDSAGRIYVADSSYFQILQIPAGGGDPENPVPTGTGATLRGFGGVYSNSGGVAVDGAGNVSFRGPDLNGASQVYEAGAASGPSGQQFQFNFQPPPVLPDQPVPANPNFTGSAPGLSNFVGGSIALDANGNLYVSDSGNSRVLYYNRQNPTVSFGTLTQDSPLASAALTLTNTGTAAVTIPSAYATITSTSPTGDTAFNLVPTPAGTAQNPTVPCTSAGNLAPGAHCTFSATFLPSTPGVQSASVSIGGSTQTVTLLGTVPSPEVGIVLSVTAPAGGAVVGQPATVTATVTQPNIPGVTPTGTVTFNYTIQGDGITGSLTATLSGSGGTSTANLPLPTLLEGRRYTINATYNGDNLDSATNATPLVVSIPGVPVTVVAPSVTFVYGTPVPALTGTVTGITDPAVTYKFVTAATSSTPIGTYPITVVFSGGSYLTYGFPPALTAASGGVPSVVVETPAALAIKANNFTTLYGAADLNYTSVVTGNVNGDQFAENYTPPNSSILNVGTYTIVPTVVSTKAGNYTITVTNGQLIVNKAPSVINVSALATTVLASNPTTDTILISVGTGIGGGKGTPTGTVTVTDTFTPIIPTAPGIGPTAAPVTLPPLTLTLGSVTFTPTSTTPGIHVYSVAYSGDSNFLCSSQLGPTYTACPSASVVTTTVTVDNVDFTVSSTTSPISIAPGVIPGGNSAIAGEAAATPQQATITVSSILSFTGTVQLSCVPQNPSYVTCTLAPAAVTVPAPASGSTTASITSIASISTPATLPLGFNFGTTSASLRHPLSKTMWAFLPLGALAFCLRRRRRLSKALWMLLAAVVMTAGLNGCGGNSVAYFTPVPAGPQTVTVFASGTSPTTNTVVTRSFTITINIQ
jgi:hypothetical protein